MTLVDANVLLDLATDDEVWADWSIAALQTAALEGPLVVNDMIYAEVAVGYAAIEQVEDFLARAGVELAAFPREALFLAAKAFQNYRRAGGPRSSILPDFFIGAHAAVLDVPLLTRDTRRYRNYFPSVRLLTPES